MLNFVLDTRTKIYFGINIAEESLKKEKELLCGNVMIVTTGRTLEKKGYIKELYTWIYSLDGVKHVCVYDSVSANPQVTEVTDAVSIGKKKNINCVVGFGGGSAMDAAKAVAVGIPSEYSIEEYLLEGRIPSEDTLPIIAIPTTAGTGSELSKGAILSSKAHHIKSGIRGDYILPRVAIVDVQYTYSLPMLITMETGFDALAHAIESYVAVKANRYSKMISEYVIKSVAQNLLLLKSNLLNQEAREAMSYASMIAGMNLANVGTGLPHRIQYAIGAKTNTSHAAGLIAVYPIWLMNEFDVSKKFVKDIMQWIGYTNIDTREDVKQGFEEYLEKLGIRYRLKDLNVSKDMVDDLTKQVTGNLANDPLAEKPNIVLEILEKSI